jgi:hypothetical protein
MDVLHSPKSATKPSWCDPASDAEVHARSTVTRDIRQWSGEQMSLCPMCLSAVRNDDWDILTEARKHQYVENPLSDAARDAHGRDRGCEADLV